MHMTAIRAKVLRALGSVGTHAFLLVSSVVALFPIVLVINNSFKTRKAIFLAPFALPAGDAFSSAGYHKALTQSNFPLWFGNSLFVTLGAMFLILLLGSMAAFALSEYKFRGNAFLTLLFLAGMMIPIRIGTVSIMRIAVSLHLINTLWALILVNVASGLPTAVFILQQFFSQVPRDMKDAARIDGASEYWIYALVLPVAKPAVATVAIYSVIPVWNDLWFPLILTSGERTKTLTLGVQQFMGQYTIDWGAILSSMTLAIVPVLVIYMLFSRNFVAGLTAGSLK
jgi:raffinose/stachyose/melibiose transport system permease protein